MIEKERLWPNEIIMNLPQIAIDFLDVFIGSYSLYYEISSSANSSSPDVAKEEAVMPRIHVYSFTTDLSDPIGDVIKRVAAVMECDPSLVSR
jgi:hypothetical protein